MPDALLENYDAVEDSGQIKLATSHDLGPQMVV